MVIAAPVFEGPLSVTNSSLIAQLREVLAGHGFTGTAVGDALGTPLPFGKSHMRDDLPLYLRRVAAPTPINTLVKLFVLDRIVDEPAAQLAFAPLDLEAVIGLGLLQRDARGIRAALRLSLYEGLLLAHDAYDEETKTLRPDHVLDVNPTTITLSNLTVRRRVRSALEIGTGCGALALLASRHADRVVATDTNPRALNLATFNAAINGVSNVEWRLGSLFEPVAGEKFDLLFCNPPYVISPDAQFIFRDGGRRGDTLCQEIVRLAPQYLNDGGHATFLINWAIRRDQDDWSTPLRSWVDGNGCDAWLLCSAAQEPVTYAAVWNRSRDREKYSAGLDRWTRYFDELDIRLLGLGAVVLRKRDGVRTWVRADHIAESIKGPVSHHIERLFAAEDRLAGLASDEALMAARFTAAADHTLQQVVKVNGGRYEIQSATVRLQNGLPLEGNVDGPAAQLIARCDGQRTLDEIARAVAAEAGLDAETFMPAAARIARRLIAAGFLI